MKSLVTLLTALAVMATVVASARTSRETASIVFAPHAAHEPLLLASTALLDEIPADLAPYSDDATYFGETAVLPPAISPPRERVASKTETRPVSRATAPQESSMLSRAPLGTSLGALFILVGAVLRRLSRRLIS